MAAGIEHSSTIDLVTISDTGIEVALIMIAAEPWTDEKVLALQAKTQSYLDFVESGGLVREHPGVAGKRVRLQLDASHQLSELAERFVAVASAEWCEPVGITFLVKRV